MSRERMPAEKIDPHAHLDETPPLLGSWRAIYLLVLGSQALCVLLFWLLTRVYS